MTGALVLAAAVAAAAVVPLTGRDYYATLMLPFFAYSVALLGLNRMFGTTGLLSFGHALFLAVGGYTAAYLGSALRVRSLEAMLVALQRG